MVLCGCEVAKAFHWFLPLVSWLQCRLHIDAARKMRQIPHFFVSGSQKGGVAVGGTKIREHELLYEVEEKRVKADLE